MKIDKTIIPQTMDPGTIRKGGFKKPGIEFHEVLRQQMPQSSGGTAIPQSTVRPIAGVSPLVSVSGHLETRQVIEQTLDTLDHFGHQLNDPSTSLRTMGPTVGQMKSQAASLRGILENLPAENPLRPVLEETRDLVHGEIDRFESGYYVDP